MAKLTKVLIMAGGTGGHIFPGLAVATQLRLEGVHVDWLGTQRGLESTFVPDAGIPLHFINISGVRGKSLKDKLLAPFRLGYALLQALKIIYQLQPDVVIGLGGFVSGPGGIASWILRKPLIVHEQNAKAGLTNKWLARVATRVLQGFPNTFTACAKLMTTGNPVRAEIAGIPQPVERFQGRTKPLRLLVVGGSLGAATINALVPRVLARLPMAERPEVIHQAGPKHEETTCKAYAQAGVSAEILPFIADMAKAYAWADLVLCRAGALTIAELCAAGLGSVLVPYPYAVDDHQTANANYLVKNHAALIVQQVSLTEDTLSAILKEFIESPTRCLDMATAAYQLRQIDATNKVLAICGEICR